MVDINHPAEKLLKQEGLQMKNLGFKVVKVYQYDSIYVCKNGMVAYAVTNDGVHVYPYHHMHGHWVGRSRDCTLSALRHGIKRGTMKLM